MSDVCHQVIASDPDGNDWDSCDRPAVGVRASLQDGDPYPVCDRHLCGGCGDAWHNRCTPIPPPPERAILTDLIAELRDEHGKRPHPLVGGSDMCQSCGVTFTVNGYCPTWHITDRAEARLKGL